MITASLRSLLYRVENICFEGKGSKVITNSAVYASECTFSGMDIGFEGTDGAWPMAYGCRFENCGTGLYFNSGFSKSRNAYYGNNTFINNRTAVLLEKIPSDDVMYFVDSVFEGNDTDIDNRAGNQIRYELDGN